MSRWRFWTDEIADVGTCPNCRDDILNDLDLDNDGEGEGECAYCGCTFTVERKVCSHGIAAWYVTTTNKGDPNKKDKREF